MSKDSLKVIREGLQAYADRGVFRGFAESSGAQAKRNFTFVWMTRRPMLLTVDTRRGVLRFANLLPNVPAGSALYADLKGFLHDRYDSALRPHRRVDRRRAEIVCQNRLGNVSVGLRITNNQYRYGLNKIINLVHEIFVYLNDLHPDYMYEAFDAPQE
ncbi:MAG: hypothetical protein ACREDR_29835 [Blastocatellia bacterium]